MEATMFVLRRQVDLTQAATFLMVEDKVVEQQMEVMMKIHFQPQMPVEA